MTNMPSDAKCAVELVIGHLKDDHRLRRNYLKGRDGDRINAVLAAAGYNFGLLRRWFEEFLRALLLLTLHRAFSSPRFA
jgi:IS5 family transposase